VDTSMPPRAAKASRRIRWWASSTPGYRSPRESSSRVLPSMSVNRNVTVPVGRSERVRHHPFAARISL
jgi:hypothetical protein